MSDEIPSSAHAAEPISTTFIYIAGITFLALFALYVAYELVIWAWYICSAQATAKPPPTDDDTLAHGDDETEEEEGELMGEDNSPGIKDAALAAVVVQRMKRMIDEKE